MHRITCTTLLHDSKKIRRRSRGGADRALAVTTRWNGTMKVEALVEGAVGGDGHPCGGGGEGTCTLEAVVRPPFPATQQRRPTVFQADDEGSIPFTRSTIFKHLHHFDSAILTSGLLLILTNCLLLFGSPAACARLPQPASWFAWRRSAAPSLTCADQLLASPHRSGRSPPPQ